LLHDNDIDLEGLSALARAQEYLNSNHGQWCITLHENDDDSILKDPCAFECMDKLSLRSPVPVPSSQQTISPSNVSSCDRRSAERIVNGLFNGQDAFSNRFLKSVLEKIENKPR